MKLFTVLIFLCLAAAPVSMGQPLASGEGSIKVPGGSVWYKITGSGTAIPLLLIHGGPGGNSCGLISLAQLGKQRPVIFYDQLGAGRSEQPDDLSLWQIARFEAELDAVRNALKLPQVHLLAHSWGAAIVGQYLANKGTQGIASVIFVGPYLSTADWVKSTNSLRQQLSAETQAILHKHELAGTTASSEYQQASNEFYQRFLYRKPYVEPPECKDSAWSQKIYEAMWGTSEFMVSGNLKNFNAAKNLARINIPSLFIIGEYDEIREIDVRRYQQQMANAGVTVIKDAAHMSMVDQPEIFAETVARFLEGVEASASAQRVTKSR